MVKNKTKKKRQHTKYNTELCDNDITFQDCELTLLRHAVDEGELNPDELLPLAHEAFADIWDAPGMEAYENYDLHKQP